MKLLFSFFIFFCLVSFGEQTNAKNYYSNFEVTTTGIKIGELNLAINIVNNKYDFELSLTSRGMLSYLFSFEGFYSVSGIFENNNFYPKLYSQKWKTKKKNREIIIGFENKKIKKLEQKPSESEFRRVEYLELEDYVDPLTSFLRLMTGTNESKTIDGRRVYTLKLFSKSLEKKTSEYFVKDYINIWADHQKNDFKKLLIVKDDKDLVPDKIVISFKERDFKLEKTNF